MIISGGVNIYPQECENLLITHPKIADAAVFGVPNADLGEEVKAVVQPMPGIAPCEELAQELIAFCSQSLSRQKVPRSIDFEDRAAAAADRQTLQAAAARPILGQQGVADRVRAAAALPPRPALAGGGKTERPQFFVANQMTWRAPLRFVVARTATSLTSKPASRSRLENAAFGPDDHTASTPFGRSARRIVFNPFKS